MSKPAARKGTITLLNASRHFKKGRPKNYLPEEDIKLLAAMYLKGEVVEGEVAVITTQQAVEEDYNLSPSRWVGQSSSAEVASVHELVKKLTALDEEAHQLSSVITKLLAGVSDESA